MTEQKQFEGGKFGYKSVSIKPDGEYSELLDYHLALLRKVVEMSLSGKIPNGWPNTLVLSEAGSQLMELLSANRKIEKQIKTVLDSIYVKDNEVEFLVASQEKVADITDKLFNDIGLNSEDPEETE